MKYSRESLKVIFLKFLIQLKTVLHHSSEEHRKSPKTLKFSIIISYDEVNQEYQHIKIWTLKCCRRAIKTKPRFLMKFWAIKFLEQSLYLEKPNLVLAPIRDYNIIVIFWILFKIIKNYSKWQIIKMRFKRDVYKA